jgi:ribosomal protein L11 methyltransferase
MEIPRKLKEFSVLGRGLSQAAKGAVQSAFLSSGVRERDLVVWDYKQYFRVSVYSITQAKEARIRKRLKSFRIKGLCSHRRVMTPKEWFSRWQESYRVMPVAKRFLIVPAWKREEAGKSKRIPVVLDPRSAFGTGGHETTQLMVRLLEPFKGKFRSFLDAGTGSGVLAIVARKLGAERIAAFDNDAMSVRIAQENFEANGGAGGHFFKADLKRLNLRKKFDLIGANLLSKTLLEYRKPILRHLAPGGHLVLSGIAKRHFGAFRKEFAGADMRCLKVLCSRSWAAAVYRKETK